MLQAWARGDQAALHQLLPLVHEELRRLARRYMRNERPGHTLQATALVNEAYLRLIEVKHVTWQDRAHFFAMSARLMRRILVDPARAKGYQKRGGGAQKVSLDEALLVSKSHVRISSRSTMRWTRWRRSIARKSQVIELRFFGGLSVEETAEAPRVARHDHARLAAGEGVAAARAAAAQRRR